MKIIPLCESDLLDGAIALAKRTYKNLSNSNLFRPVIKTIAYSDNAITEDVLVCVIKLLQNPASDVILIINANEFRIISAINMVESGDYFPTLMWNGGTPPFVIKLAAYTDGTLITDVSNMCVNVNTNLTDGTGDLVLADDEKVYRITKIDTDEDWWADDLVGSVDAERQNQIGIMIEDSSIPPRKLFAPFSPTPTYESDGTTKTGLSAIYTQYGPKPWCVPLIRWPEVSVITYGQALRVGIELAAFVYIPGTETTLTGTMSYFLDAEHTQDAVGYVPDSPTTPIYATFQADDTDHYHLAVGDYGVVIGKQPQSITVTLDSFINHYPYVVGDVGTIKATGGASGNPVIVTSSNTSVATVSGYASDSAGATISYIGVGSEYLYLDQAGSDNYLPAIRITGATHTVLASNNLVDVVISGLNITYTGTAAPVGITTTPSGHGVTVTYNASTTVPINAGTYSVVATVTDSAYTGSATGTLVIAKSVPIITWDDPIDIIEGTVLSGTQLNATTNVDGTFVYDPPAGATPTASSGLWLNVVFTPTDSANYTTATERVGIIVISAKQDQEVTFIYMPSPITINDTSFIVVSTTGPHTEVDFTPDDTSVVSVTSSGIQGIVGWYANLLAGGTPGSTEIFINKSGDATYNDIVNYSIGTITTSEKLNPVITWNLVPLVYPYPVTDQQLNATANVGGTFEYTADIGDVFTPTGPILSCAFTPSDTTTYNIVYAERWLPVAKHTPVITWNPIFLANGQSLSANQLNATADVQGTFVYGQTIGTLMYIPGAALACVFTPTDPSLYESFYTERWLTVGRVDPIITWSPPSINYGEALTSAHRGATASTPGAFTYGFTVGTLLNAGIYTLQVDFVPTDETSYNAITTNREIAVYRVAQSTFSCQLNSYNASPGQTVQASGIGGSGDGQILFQSLNNSVASVHWTTGVVTAIAAGTTTIQAIKQGGTNHNDTAWVSATSVLTVREAINPITYSFATFASINNLRVNFAGGNGSYTVTQFGSRTNLSVDTSHDNYMYLAGTWGASTSCYQSGGYFVIAQANNLSNSVSLPYATWFSLLGISACAGSEVPPVGGSGGIANSWYSHSDSNPVVRDEYYFPSNNLSGTLTWYYDVYGAFLYTWYRGYWIVGTTLYVQADGYVEVYAITDGHLTRQGSSDESHQLFTR